MRGFSSTGHSHTITLDFEAEYSEDELMDLGIKLSKMLFGVSNKILAIRTGGFTNAPATIEVAQSFMQVMADDMQKNVFDKAAKEQRDAATE